MKKFLLLLALIALGSGVLCSCSKPESPEDQPATGAAGGSDATPPLSKESLAKAKQAIDKGVQFLLDKQATDGHWVEDPAITALACTALHLSGSEEYAEEIEAAVNKGREVILGYVTKDGSFRGSLPKYVNYTTATCLYALAMINNPEDEEIMRNARHFLIDLQLDEDNATHPTPKSSKYHGGIGYSSQGPERPDLSNTQLALEALYVTEHLDTEAGGGTPEDAAKAKLCWENAIGFLKNVQNMPEGADESWTVPESADSDNDGGFFYHPEQSKASEKFEDAQSLRSFGSMTYAGLKSMLYAKLDKDDYRVKAAIEWARRNYTLDENPGMGPEGHFYYLMTFAKAHAAYGEPTVETPDGTEHSWREDLVNKLVSTQKEDGHWVNEAHGRYMESLPELVTAYSLIALENALAE